MTASRPPGTQFETLTYLEMCSPAELRPAQAVRDLRLRAAPADDSIRAITTRIGFAHHWPSLAWDDERWRTYLARPHLGHWTAVLDEAEVGLVSVDAQPSGQVEIDTFGLIPEVLGQGLGGWFLTLATRPIWDRVASVAVERVWLHTSSLDHPAALVNYCRRGFRPYRSETVRRRLAS